MRYVFLPLFTLIGWSACTSHQEAGIAIPQGSSLIDYFSQSKPAIRGSFTDVPINSSAFCTPGPASNCAKEVINYQRQLMLLDPLPVPQPNTDVPISVDQADQLYRRFVAEHTGQPILAVFRQLFPRILLNKYSLITSTNYPLITYYAQELIESGSGDVVTQANALKTIQLHMPASQFTRLARAAAINVHRYVPVQKQQFEQSMVDLNDTGVDSLLLPEAVRKQLKEQISEDNRSIQRAFAEIEQFQRQAVH